MSAIGVAPSSRDGWFSASAVGGVALLVTLAPPVGAVPVVIDPDPARVIQNETSLTLVPGVPGLPALLAVAYNNDPTSPVGLGFGESTDSGITWTTRPLPLPLDPAGSGQLMTDAFDPAIARDHLGSVYVAHISLLFGYPGASGLFVHRYDWGTTGLWWPPVCVAYRPAAVGFPDPNYRLNDKCHVAVDISPTSPRLGSVYATWIQDGGAGVGPASDIFFATSTTQGTTWTYPSGSTAPVPINDNPYVPFGPPSDMANGPNVAIAPDGRVYVAWMDIDVTLPQGMGTLKIDRSMNGGFSWGADIVVQPNVLNCPGHLTTGLGAIDARARSYPSVAVGPSMILPGRYPLYVVYAADPDGPLADEGDVFFTTSTDNGTTWSMPLRLNKDQTASDQFEPWVQVKPDGTIDVIWYDRQLAPMDDLWDVAIVRSCNGGQSFSKELFLTAPVSSFPTPIAPWGEAWMGEYPGLAVDGAWAYVAFTSSIGDVLGDVYFDKIPNMEITTAAPTLTPERPALRLSPSRPNPFEEWTTVSFSLASPGPVRVIVHDVQGRLVRELLDGPRTTGDHSVVWDGRDRQGRNVASGQYFCRLEVGDQVFISKVTRVK